MAIIGAFTGTCCREDPAIREIVQRTGFKYLTDADILAKASSLSGFSERKLRKAFRAGIPFFNQMTHEKDLTIAYLKMALAETLKEDNIVIHGLTSLLIPSSIVDVLRICIVPDMKAGRRDVPGPGLSERKVSRKIRKDDRDRITWVRDMLGKDDFWDGSLYDMLLSVDKMTPEEIGDLVAETAGKVLYMRTLYAQKVIEDFILASRVEVALIRKGYYYVATEADAGAVTLTINKNVIMLKRLENRLQYEAKNISGVTSALTKVGKDFYQADIVGKLDLIAPSNPLWLDERQSVSALSEKAVLRRSNRIQNRLRT